MTACAKTQCWRGFFCFAHEMMRFERACGLRPCRWSCEIRVGSGTSFWKRDSILLRLWSACGVEASSIRAAVDNFSSEKSLQMLCAKHIGTDLSTLTQCDFSKPKTNTTNRRPTRHASSELCAPPLWTRAAESLARQLFAWEMLGESFMEAVDDGPILHEGLDECGLVVGSWRARRCQLLDCKQAVESGVVNFNARLLEELQCRGIIWQRR